MTKWVYSFGAGRNEGSAELRDLLGGKGANLAEMAAIGLPVPPGFTITTEVCTEYYTRERHYPDDLQARSRRRPRPDRGRRRPQSSATGIIRCWSRSAPAPACPCPA